MFVYFEGSQLLSLLLFGLLLHFGLLLLRVLKLVRLLRKDILLLLPKEVLMHFLLSSILEDIFDISRPRSHFILSHLCDLLFC